MKDIFAMLIVVFGASVFQRGFNMLSSGLQDKFAKEMHEKMSAGACACDHETVHKLITAYSERGLPVSPRQ